MKLKKINGISLLTNEDEIEKLEKIKSVEITKRKLIEIENDRIKKLEDAKNERELQEQRAKELKEIRDKEQKELDKIEAKQELLQQKKLEIENSLTKLIEVKSFDFIHNIL
jgi:flagellar biosynthesis GTPase FlhF